MEEMSYIEGLRAHALLVSVQTAAELLDCSVSKVTQLVRSGVLPCVMLPEGRVRRIPFSALEKLVEAAK